MVRVHTCNQRIEGYLAERCTCRKFVTVEKAEKLVGDGDAEHIKISYKIIHVEVKCPVCEGTGLRSSCSVCGKTGKVMAERDVFEYGEDIFMVSVKKTPRTATIEAEHIEYAYIKQDRDAAKRIELYGQSNQLSLVKYGAQLTDPVTGEVVLEGTPEPKNGRERDWGRCI